MVTEILADAARFIHFIGFALGIGAGSFADFSILRKINTDITTCDLGNLETVHKIVWTGLGLLWVSGLIILYTKTGFSILEFTPKLIMKLAVVVLLTVNAFLLGLWAIPILKKNINRPYISFSLEHKTVLSLLASISVCSWLSGLILGIFSTLRPADFDIILPIFATLYGLAIIGSVIMTIIMHIIWERRIKAYSAKKKQEAKQVKNNSSIEQKTNPDQHIPEPDIRNSLVHGNA